MKTKIQKFAFDNFTLEAESDTYKGELLDTVITIYPKNKPELSVHITTIAGNTIESFISGLSQLIDEHKI